MPISKKSLVKHKVPKLVEILLRTAKRCYIISLIHLRNNRQSFSLSLFSGARLCNLGICVLKSTSQDSVMEPRLQIKTLPSIVGQLGKTQTNPQNSDQSRLWHRPQLPTKTQRNEPLLESSNSKIVVAVQTTHTEIKNTICNQFLR